MDTSSYDYIYLSPHLDDAVLSCGGTIHCQSRQGLRSLVVSIFAGSPKSNPITSFARELEQRWGAAGDAAALRRQEDLEAVQRVGAQALHLELLDCVYRTSASDGRPLYPSEESIFGPVHEEEAALHIQVLEALQSALEPSSRATIVAPLGIGNHVDHVITRRAAMVLASQGRSVLFYEDMPYCLDWDGEAHTLLSLMPGALQREIVYLSQADLKAKQEAVACYRSQLSTFWASAEEMRHALAEAALTVGGGRFAESRWHIVEGRRHSLS